MRAMYRGLAISTVVMLGLVYVLNQQTAIPAQDATGHALSAGALWLCALLGSIVTAVMMWITDVYTGDGSRFAMRYNCTRLVWAEEFDRIEEAIAREKAIKNWPRLWKLRMIQEANPMWDDLAPSDDDRTASR